MRTAQKGVVVEIAAGNAFQQRMVSMGIYPGKMLTKLSHFVLRGPVTVRVGRSTFAFGHGVAKKIIVSVE